MDKLDADKLKAVQGCIFRILDNHARNDGYFGEQDCDRLGAEILTMVLRQFRPDLF